MKILLKLVALAAPLTFATGCVIHERHASHYPPPPPPRQPQVVVVEQPAPAPQPQVVIVRPAPPAPAPRVVIVRPPPPTPQPKVVIVRPPPPAPQPQVVIVKAPPPTPEPLVIVVSPRPPAGVPIHAREHSVQTPAPEPQQVKEPWVNVTISTHERQVIREYVTVHSDDDNPGKKGHKGKSLPPGLAKKAARGESLPPGWEKKLARGQTMPAEVYRQCQPLPVEVTERLPAPPRGTILVTIEGKVVRLAQATLEILDVFDVL